jgi:hypothetical protein
MIKPILFTVLLAMSTLATAKETPSIWLEGPEVQTVGPNRYAPAAVQGQCGASGVKLDGILTVLHGAFSGMPTLTLSNANKTTEFDAQSGIFNDSNGVACVVGKKSKYLLVWSRCSGSVCTGPTDFFVINTQTHQLEIPKRNGQNCNARCASQYLGGNELPLEVDPD